jgi:hypothetical protein
MASMRNWLHEKEGRVVVVHCKAGKGRSGTASCSYLISEEGWTVHKALQRFTERRMRPNMGKGVSIPSQLRWIGYVDRWKHNKIYVERQIEVLEVHCWGLRDGVKIQIEGFVDDGKLIKRFHTFAREEREVVRGEVKTTTMTQAVQEVMYKNGLGRTNSKKVEKPQELRETEDEAFERATENPQDKEMAKSGSLDGTTESKESKIDRQHEELGTGDVVFRPARRVVLPTNDINIDVERRNKAAFDLTMVTAVAHVWFNAYFEGNGPEQNGIPDESGVFEITWEAMDGIKGSSRKGTQAFEKIAVVWKALKAEEGRPGVVITEPKEGEPVKQSQPADWKGTKGVTPSDGKDLGLRTSSPTDSTANVSKASSLENLNNAQTPPVITKPGRDSEDNHLQHVRSHGPNGEEIVDEPSNSSSGRSGNGPDTTVEPTLPSKAGDEAAPRAQHPESHTSGVRGIVSGVQHVSTDALPDGRPEHSMKTAKEHALGSLSTKKKP